MGMKKSRFTRSNIHEVRRILSGPAILIMSLTLILTLVGCAHMPEFAAVAQSTDPIPSPSEIDPTALLPILVMSQKDIDERNGIEAIFLTRSQDLTSIEVTLVFKDEDHPNALADVLYDRYRVFKYGRKADLESFVMHISAETGELLDISFKGSYGGNQPFATSKTKKSDAVIPADALVIDCTTLRPVLFVSTWDHLLSEIDPNTDMTDRVQVEEYPIYYGTRDDVERIFKIRE